MAKKMWAYALLNGEYVSDQKSGKKRNRLFYIWEALRLRRISEDSYSKRTVGEKQEFDFLDLTFMSTHKNISWRKQLHPVKSGYFRYSQGKAGDGQGGDGESISHQLAILALSNLSVIPFIINNKELPLAFTEFAIDGEDTRIQLDGGKSYYIDLIGYLDKQSPMYHEWGGKVGIEVKYTHGYERTEERIQLFERHNIAILEVSITKGYIYPSERKKPYTSGGTSPDELEAHFNKLVKGFGQQTYAKLLSNPLLGNIARNRIIKLTDALSESTTKINELQSFEQKQTQHLAWLDLELKNAQYQLENANRHLTDMQNTHKKEISSLKSQKERQISKIKLKTKIVAGFIFALALTLVLTSIALPNTTLTFAKFYLNCINSIHGLFFTRG